MMMLFKKKKKELPKLHWKDITIARNKAILDVYDRYEGQEKDLFFLYDLTCAAYGKPSDWIDGMKVGEANEYINSLAIVNEKPKVNIVTIFSDPLSCFLAKTLRPPPVMAPEAPLDLPP